MFEWEQFLDVAVYLQELGDSNHGLSEAAYRCAVSRAYYGAYHCALSLANRCGFDAELYLSDRRMSEHRKLQVWYKEKYGNKSMGNSISKQLHRLHDWRKDADYKDTTAKEINFKISCQNAILLSKELVQKIQLSS